MIKNASALLLILSPMYLTACDKQATSTTNNSSDSAKVENNFATEQRVLSISGKTMGTTYHIKWVDSSANNSIETKSIIQKAVDDRLLKINQSMSTYDPTSEISTFNKQNKNVSYKVSKDFFTTISLAQKISQQSNGAFDVTVSPLINLWGFGHKGVVTKKPTDEQIQTIKESIGYQKLKLIPQKQKIQKLDNITINLSAIAKGYGVDAIAKTLEQYKIFNYFVEIGGEVIAKGTKPNKVNWVVGIEKPVAGKKGVLQEAINISGTAIATSGDYRNYFEENGIRYSHTIDPSTGYPINHKLASVSVLMPTCAEADGIATTLMVLGDKKGVDFAKQNNIDALFVVKSDNGFSEVMTGNFKNRLISN